MYNLLTRYQSPGKLLLPLILIIIFCSCKKGDTGPAGADGINGLNGLDGNANVTTDTFSISAEQWKYNSIYWVGTTGSVSQGQISKYYERESAQITDSILNQGAVLVYIYNPNSLQGWTALPLTWLDNFTGNYSYNFAFVPTKGKLTMHFFFAKVAGNAIPVLLTFSVPAIKVKVVSIDAKLKLNSAQINNLKTLSYDAAKSTLHFED